MADDRPKRGARDHFETLDKGRFVRVARGHEDALVAEATQPPRGDEHAVHVADRPVEGQLADEGAAVGRSHLEPRENYRHRHRKVEPRAVLAKLGRRQVDGEPAARELETAVDDRRPDAVPRLFHRWRRQPDHDELAFSATDVRLHVHATYVEAGEHARVNASEHGPTLATGAREVSPAC